MWRSRLRSVLLKSLLVASVIFIVANVCTPVLYNGRALPHYYLGRMNIGGKSLSALQSTSSNEILPPRLTLQKGNTQAQQTPANLGISADRGASLRSLDTLHRWLPALSLVSSRHVHVSLRVDNARFARAANLLGMTFSYPAAGRHITFDGSAFVIAPAHNGYQLDSAAL